MRSTLVPSRRTFDDLAQCGHFYSDRRLRRLVTTCFDCGREWSLPKSEEEAGEVAVHKAGCKYSESGKKDLTRTPSSVGTTYSYLEGFYARWLVSRPNNREITSAITNPSCL